MLFRPKIVQFTVEESSEEKTADYRMQRDELLSMLANWIVDVEDKGREFENWKDSYEDAAITNSSLTRDLIDKEVAIVRNFRKD